MAAENTSQPADLNEETRNIWDQNAAFWDDNMGDGNDFQRLLTDPCFNHTGVAHCAEEATVNGEVITTYSIKVTKYLHNGPQKGIAMLGQPIPQYYFDRPLHILFNTCFRAGLVLDGLEEPAFN